MILKIAFFKKRTVVDIVFEKMKINKFLPTRIFPKFLIFLIYFFGVAPKDYIFCCFFHVYSWEKQLSVFWKTRFSESQVEIDFFYHNFAPARYDPKQVSTYLRYVLQPPRKVFLAIQSRPFDLLTSLFRVDWVKIELCSE